jgi:hypothetical protein
MEELRAETLDVLASLTEEQVQKVLAYARSLRDSEEAMVVSLEELLESPA